MRIDREEVFEVTIPAETAPGTPVTIPTVFPPGQVVQFELVVRPGSSGEVGVRIGASGRQLYPRNTGAFIISDDEVIRREVHNWPNSGRYEVTGYNLDSNAHSVELRFGIVETSTRPVATSTTTPPVEVTEDGEVSQGTPGLPQSPESPATLETPPETTSPEPPSSTPESPKGTESEAPEPPTSVQPEPAEPQPPSEPPLGAEEPTPTFGEAVEEPEPVASAELTPEERAYEAITGGTAAPGFGRKPPSKAAKHPGAKYTLSKHRVQVKPRTGVKTARTDLSGHPEVKRGVATLVNIIRGQFPRLQITSTTSGKHATNSLHYTGQAVDLASGDAAYMQHAAEWIAAHLKRYLTEGIHNPGLSVKDAADVPSSFWGEPTWGEHRNHIHVGVAGAQEALLLKDNQPTSRTVTTKHVVKAPVRKPAKEKRPKSTSQKRTVRAGHHTGGTSAPAAHRKPTAKAPAHAKASSPARAAAPHRVSSPSRPAGHTPRSTPRRVAASPRAAHGGGGAPRRAPAPPRPAPRRSPPPPRPRPAPPPPPPPPPPRAPEHHDEHHHHR